MRAIAVLKSVAVTDGGRLVFVCLCFRLLVVLVEAFFCFLAVLLVKPRLRAELMNAWGFLTISRCSK